MAETKSCPKCGAELPADAPAGICPKCLMQAGLASEQDAGSESNEMEPTTLTPGFVPPEPEALAEHFPQLEILELLGIGGMGAVYKARQKSLDRLVALKIIRPGADDDPGFAERFSREAKALARLSHPSIVTIYDFGESDGLYYLVMEYVDGVNLRQAMQAGPLEAGETLQIVPHICDALQYAHDEGIVHRDIKPENILIDKKGRVKIADFGLAKLVGGEKTDPTLTGTRQVMGTLRYMAPEQMQSSRNVDHRADIYSLGVVFYEMLTGETPLGHFEPPSKKAAIDVRLDDVVLRALASEPERRFQQADELKSSVEQITSHPDVEIPLPVDRGNAGQSVGISTIFEREAVNLRNWFVPEPGQSTKQHPTLPAALMILLSIAGCLMVLLPWMVLQIDQVTEVNFKTEQLAGPVQETLFGSSRWPGIVTAIAFGCFALLLIVTAGNQRLTVTRSVVMAAIAALALLLTFSFRVDFESDTYPLTFVGSRHSNLDSHGGDYGEPTDGVLDHSTNESGVRRSNSNDAGLADENRRLYTLLAWMHSIDHRITYREGFYGSLGLSLVLLVLSATGVRHATVWRAENKKERKRPADPDKPADTAAPLTSVRFFIPEEMEIGAQVVFHFSGLGYRLVEERANEWIFRRGKWWAGLWLTDINNCDTTLTVRTVAQPQGGLWVSCGWVVKTYGGFISGGSIKQLEAEGHELEAILTGSDISTPTADDTVALATAGADAVANDVEGIAPRPHGVPQQIQPQQRNLQRDSGFWMTPQPGFGKRVVAFVLIVLGVVMVASLAAVLLSQGTIEFFPQGHTESVPQLLFVPMIILLLAVLWAVRRARSRSLGRAERAHRPQRPHSLLARILIGLAVLWLLAVCGGALVWSLLLRRPTGMGIGASGTPPASPFHYDKTEKGRQDVVKSTNVDSRNWVFGPDGPQLTDWFASPWLRPSQVEPVNKALQELYREYLALEAQHTQQLTTDDGHVVTTVEPLPKELEAIEGRLWSRLDPILDAEQHNIFRLNLELYALAQLQRGHVGKSLPELVRPGLFGWGDLGARIEIWREGTWFRWKVKAGSYEDSSRASELPADYRRFWKEPAQKKAAAPSDSSGSSVRKSSGRVKAGITEPTHE